MLLEQSGKRLLEHKCCNPYYKGTPWRRVRRDWRRKLDFEVDANLGKWGKNNFTQRNNEKSCKRQAFVWPQRNFFHFLTDKADFEIYLHSFHERFTSYQKTLALCFCQRKWFSLRCWLNYSRKVFLWGNKMLHITISHHIWKNTRRKIIYPWFCSKNIKY